MEHQNQDDKNNHLEQINGSAIANSIDSAVNKIIKEKKRFNLIKFIVKAIMFIFAFIFIAGALKNGGSNMYVTSSSSHSQNHTALISIDGEISAQSKASAEMINASLQDAFKSEQSKAIIVKINSPGGSPVQSGMVYDEIKRLRKIYPAKHIYTVVEDICASGAYYIAAATDAIYVDKASMVGSIGVVMNGFGFNKAIDKVGVERRMYTAGANKGMLDPFSPENPSQKAYIQNMLNEVHGQFIAAVKNGRGNKLKEDKDTFSGLVWSGAGAVQNGLADGFNTVNGLARDVIKQEEIIDYTLQEGLADKLAKQFGTHFGAGLYSAAASKINSSAQNSMGIK
jgi:protease IV